MTRFRIEKQSCDTSKIQLAIAALAPIKSWAETSDVIVLDCDLCFFQVEQILSEFGGNEMRSRLIQLPPLGVSRFLRTDRLLYDERKPQVQGLNLSLGDRSIFTEQDLDRPDG